MLYSFVDRFLKELYNEIGRRFFYHQKGEKRIMKEQIYTIPVNEAYDIDCECPLCYLESTLEKEAVEYALGAAMMEPDYRVESNKKGYCNHHFRQMFHIPNKLSLALVLDTHLEEVRKALSTHQKEASRLSAEKTGFFKKNGVSDFCSALSYSAEHVVHDCMVCEKVNKTMQRYGDVLLYMWANDAAFKIKFEQSKGVCLPHFKMLAELCPKSLSNKQATQFITELYQKEISALERIQEDIHRFTLKFDYRNQDMDWGNAQDAPLRTIEKLAGYIHTEEEKG